MYVFTKNLLSTLLAVQVIAPYSSVETAAAATGSVPQRLEEDSVKSPVTFRHQPQRSFFPEMQGQNIQERISAKTY